MKNKCILKNLIVISLLSLCVTSCSEDGIVKPPDPDDPDPQSYSQSFTGNDNDPWPAEWSIPAEVSSPLTNASIQSNAGYLEGIAGSTQVTRMVMQSTQNINFEVEFRFKFSNLAGQGIGFYGRQNGGRLTGTPQHGQGYAVFIEGFSNGNTLNLELWHELDGVETRETRQRMSSLVASNDSIYRVKFRVEQTVPGVSTTMTAKIWLENESEPAAWDVTSLSSTAQFPAVGVLQDLTGGFAVDVYNESQTGGIYIDDINITGF